MTMKGHIRQRSKGSWAIILDLGRDADGKRRQKWHTVRGTKKDAQRELAKLLHQLHTGEYVEPMQMTAVDYLKIWLRDYAKVNVAGKTYERYAEIIERHLIPVLGHHALPKLQPLHIQGLLFPGTPERSAQWPWGTFCSDCNAPITVCFAKRCIRPLSSSSSAATSPMQ